MVIDKCKNCCYTEVASKKIDESEGIAMKKKRIISFALALVMMAGVLSVVAVAYSCPYCGKSNTVLEYDDPRELAYTTRVDGGCPNTMVSHLHYTYRTARHFVCQNVEPSYCKRKFVVYKYDYDVCYM